MERVARTRLLGHDAPKDFINSPEHLLEEGSRKEPFPSLRFENLDNWTIGRFLHLKSEIRDFESDCRPHEASESNLRFRISDLRCRNRPIVQFLNFS
jgi:hypothetical protein